MKKILVCFNIFLILISYLIYAQTWSPPQRLTFNTGYSTSPHIAVDFNDNIHIVWSDDTPGKFRLYYKKSTDGGETWSAAKRLTWFKLPLNFGQSRGSFIAVDHNNSLHLFWHEKLSGIVKEIFYKNSTDSGATWTTAKRLTWTPPSSSGYATATYPKVAIESNNIMHLVWSAFSAYGSQVHHKKSLDGGLTWSGAERISWGASVSERPAIAIDSNDNLHLVRVKAYPPQNREIYYKKSADSGTTWTARTRISWTVWASTYPSIAVTQNGSIHIIWQESTKGGDILYKGSTDDGSNWFARRLTWTHRKSSTIEGDNMNHVHVVWENDSAPLSIEYKKSVDDGANWTSIKRLNWTPGYSKQPTIAIDSNNNIHVAWRDDNSGNYEIYYKKGIQ